MKELIKRLKSPKFKAAFRDYLIGVGASAIAATLALAMDFAPEYAILIAGITAPLAAWADKNRKEYGRTE
jgi:hypothetical protein